MLERLVLLNWDILAGLPNVAQENKESSLSRSILVTQRTQSCLCEKQLLRRAVPAVGATCP